MPIKLNNERLQGKNTKLLGGKPLIQYSLNTLLKAQKLDEIDVFCSDDAIREYLIDGINFLKRPNFLDLPKSNFTQIFEEFYKLVDADIYVYAHATAPFIKVETINECIESVVSGKYDSAFTATVIQDFLWKDGKPLNFEQSNLPRSQDLTPIYRETSGVYVFKKEVFSKYHTRIGKQPFIKEVDFKEAVDINTLQDFEFAELVL
ncbi:MAG: acylneuraminate cytidylyltransferase [Hungatella sp.]|nr:acylneuraminate cytidylyltransferase [Hungatella sp.]